jgi:hypothetical protein
MMNQFNSYKNFVNYLIPTIATACIITSNLVVENLFAQSTDCDLRQSQLQQSMPPRGERLVLTSLDEWPQEIAGRGKDTEEAIKRAQERMIELDQQDKEAKKKKCSTTCSTKKIARGEQHIMSGNKK